MPAETVEKIVQTTLSPPPAGRNRWTTRLLARKFKLTSATVSKILRANGLKPHPVRTYKVSRDSVSTSPPTSRAGTKSQGLSSGPSRLPPSSEATVE